MPAKTNLSLAIITYKRPRLLKRCLKSIAHQNKPNLPIIIIDNDSQKSAYPIFNQHQKQLNLKYFNEPIKNISLARNLALEVCQTPYLAFVDDDCTLTKNWLLHAAQAIKLHPQIAFFQGGTNPSKTKNPLVLAQQKLYFDWIKNNHLDTKNLILNLTKIKSLSLQFDPKLPIFEDVDFGLQASKHHLQILYLPKMAVYHRQVSNLFKLLPKTYYRGRIKYILNQKWSDFDHFSPLNTPKDIIKNLLTHGFFITLIDYLFSQGFISAKKLSLSYPSNTIHIVNTLKKDANETRAKIVADFLKTEGFKVKIIDSQKVFDTAINQFKNFSQSPFYFLLYRLERFLCFSLKISFLKSHLFYLELKLRGRLLHHYLTQIKAQTVISQDPKDLSVSLKPRSFQLIFDLPTVFSEEIKLHHLNFEETAYQKCDHLFFHWYTFVTTAQNKYPKLGNISSLNWGSSPIKKTAEFSSHPKIIYLGKLNADWINPKLLENLHQKYSIDIYGYENPNPQMYQTLSTKGYLKNLDDLSSYQFGLLTFTNDSLRNNGFSAKILDYLSRGLPVFCPEWRQDSLLEPAVIYYNEHNFQNQLKKYSHKNLWLEKHQAALKIAKSLQWTETLKPLSRLLSS